MKTEFFDPQQPGGPENPLAIPQFLTEKMPKATQACRTSKEPAKDRASEYISKKSDFETFSLQTFGTPRGTKSKKD